MYSKTPEALQLSDAEESDRRRTMAEKSSGCYVSTLAGFFLLLLGLILVVGVGILVHFSGPKPDCDTKCPAPSVNNGDGTWNSSPSENQQWETCKRLSAAKNECLSAPHCPGMVSSSVTPPSKTKPGVSRPKDVRLPLDVLPEHYDLELKPDIYVHREEDFKFDGSVKIHLLCIKATNVITMHMKKLNIDNSTIALETRQSTKPAPSVSHYSRDMDREFIKFHLSEELEVGSKYILALSFSGELNDDLAGLYRSSYKKDNDTVWIATSQMQPTDARKTFPCFDEPAIKATFSVVLVRRQPMVSLSNMPIMRSVNRGGGWVADVYEKSVKMPTYLLAFIVCDFQYKQRYSANGKVRFRVWARKDAIDQVDYALDIGVRILEYFETYFDLDFPLPKQDMIAIPDFAAGAMENWGLITYRETALLYDSQSSSTSDKQWVAIVVAHELAHQWFGNIVSPSWWDDLWLNEGFATYVEYLGVDHVEPRWKMLEQFVRSEVHGVFPVDSLSSSHPIYVPVAHPAEISEIFDTISYAKGASILRMLNFILTSETFTSGLTRYLKRHAYGNANHTDLWQSLSEAALLAGSNIDVAAVMNTWILQMGFPMVTISRDPQNKDIAQVRQQHFLTDPEQKPDEDKFPSPYGYKWKIPMTYTMSNFPNWTNPKFEWMDLTNIRIGPLDPNAAWIIGNIGMHGYYVVNYDLDNWNALIDQLKNNHWIIPELNRAQIISDVFKIGRAGYIDQLLALRVTEYLTSERDYIPWAAARDNLDFVSEMLSRTAAYGNFQAYMVERVLPLYTRLGWDQNDNDDHLEKYLRGIALNYACGYNHKDCVDRAVQMYKTWMEIPTYNRIPQDHRSLVYCNAIKHGDEAEWNFAHQQYHSSNSANEKIRLLYAMACTKKAWIINKYLSMTWNSSEIRLQDATRVMIYASWNDVGRYIVWNFVRANWEKIYERFGDGFFALSSIIDGITPSFNTEYELQQLKTFQNDHPDIGSGNRALKQAIEKTEANKKWMDRNYQKFSEWLETNISRDFN